MIDLEPQVAMMVTSPSLVDGDFHENDPELDPVCAWLLQVRPDPVIVPALHETKASLPRPDRVKEYVVPKSY
jgi:hypothetical protein